VSKKKDSRESVSSRRPEPPGSLGEGSKGCVGKVKKKHKRPEGRCSRKVLAYLARRFGNQASLKGDITEKRDTGT